MSEGKTASSDLATTLQKGLQILRCFATGRDEWGVREVAREVNLSKSTAHRLLQTFEKEGFLESEPDSGRYRIGLELYRIASSISSKMDLGQAAMPVMKDLAAECEETVYLVVYRHREIVFLHKVDCSHPVKYVVEMGQSQSVHCGATGKAVMAFLPEDEREAIVAGGLTPLTPNTIIDPAQLRKDLEEVRRRGYAISFGERIIGAVGVAAPVWGSGGRLIGALDITVPDSRFYSGRDSVLGSMVCRHALRLSLKLGHIQNDGEVGSRKSYA
ncbi:MAG: IclR family transcriptional regulator [Actinobacteria bacterium]|nr:IclR family transcriptional regulator [Actinomycetota bacterium]